MAGGTSITTDQVELMKQMNVALEKQLEVLIAIEQRMGGQSQVTRDATVAVEDYNKASDQMATSTEGVGEGFKSASGFFDNFTSKIQTFVGSDAYNNITSSFSDGVSLLKVNFQSLAQIVSNPVAAAMGFLANNWEILIAKAIELWRESIRVAEALERVREKFGSFNENTSRRIKTAYKEFGDTLKTTAANAGQFNQKFAAGADGAIEKIETMLGIAEDLGPTFDVMGQQFNDAADNLYLLKEGLLFGSDALKQTAVLANLSGKSLKSFSMEIMGTINKISKNFGISSKVLGQDVGKALSNFKMLGRMTGDYVKEITKAAVFTRKLGIELNELTGLVDKFDEFEGGAEAAAQLAQGFGLVIDPLKMMGMEAAPRLQELQRAFMATGRSIESMSRVERKLLADTAGLTEEQAALAFSAKGMAMSYDEIASGADAAAKKQKSNEQVMFEVLDNIKNVFAGIEGITGFVTAFFEGFGRGFMGEGSILKLLWKLVGGMQTVRSIGYEVGNMFAKIVFGGGDARSNGQAMLQIFAKVGDMFVEISRHIKTFVAALESGDIVSAAKNLFSGVFGSIEKMFTGASAGINMGAIVSKIGKFMLDMVRGAIRFLVEKIPEYTKQLKGMFSEGGEESMLGTMVHGIGDALKQLVDELPALLPVLQDFATELIEAIPKFFEKYKVAGLFVGGGPLAVFVTGFMGGLFDMMSSYFTEGKFTEEIMGKAHGSVESAAKAATAAAAGDVAAAAAAGAAQPKVPEEVGFMETMLNAGKGLAAAGAVATGVVLAPTIFTTLAEGIRNSILVFTRKLSAADGVPDEYVGMSTIEILAAQVKLFNGIDPGAISAVGGMIAGIVSSSTSIMGLAVSGIKTLTTEQITAIQESISTTLTIYQGVVDRITGTELEAALQKSTKFNANVEKLKSVGGSMSGLAETLKSIISSIPKKSDLADIGTETDTLDTKLRTAVGMVISLFQNTMQGPGILSQLADLTIPADLTAAKIKSIVSVADAARLMGDSASSLATVGKSAFTTSDITHALTLIMTIGDNLPPVFESFGKLIAPAEMAKSESRMKGALNVLTSYLNGASEITSSKLEAARALDFNDMAFTPITTSGPGSLSEIMESVSAPGVFPDAASYDANIASIDKFFNLIDKYMDGMSSASTKLSATRMQQVEQRVTALVEHTATIRRILEDLKTIPLDATITAIEENMKVAKTTMKIAGGAVNINVQMNVSMNAEKMASALVMGGYIKPSDEFDKYMQTGYETDKTFDGINADNYKGYSTASKAGG